MAKKDKQQQEQQAERVKDVSAPRLDLIFAVYRNQFLSLDSEGTPLAVINCRLRETADKYGAHGSPDHAEARNVAEYLTAQLWSRESRAKLGQLMLRPILHSKSGGVIGWTDRQSLQQARQTIARELIAEYRRVASALPCLVPRNEAPETVEEKFKRKDEIQRYAEWERSLAESLATKPENRRRLFGRIVDEIASQFSPRAEAEPELAGADSAWTERYGETRAAYVERMKEVGMNPQRLAKRVAEREAQL